MSNFSSNYNHKKLEIHKYKIKMCKNILNNIMFKFKKIIRFLLKTHQYNKKT